MTNYKNIADLVSDLIISSIVYVFITIFAGYVEARIAKKLGDRTAEHEGFLSLNPLIYLDWLGFFCFLMTGYGMLRIGWGRPVPINPANFKGKHKRLELLFAYYSGVISLCIVGLGILILTVLFLGGYMVQVPMLSVLSLHQAFTHALFAIAGTTITYSFGYALFMFVVATIRFFILTRYGHNLQAFLHAEMYSRLITLAIMLLFGRYLYLIMLLMIRAVELYTWAGWKALATFLGFITWYM